MALAAMKLDLLDETMRYDVKQMCKLSEKLLKQLIEIEKKEERKEDIILISPYSIFLTLSMLGLAVGNETLQKLSRFCEFKAGDKDRTYIHTRVVCSLGFIQDSGIYPLVKLFIRGPQPTRIGLRALGRVDIAMFRDLTGKTDEECANDLNEWVQIKTDMRICRVSSDTNGKCNYEDIVPFKPSDFVGVELALITGSYLDYGLQQVGKNYDYKERLVKAPFFPAGKDAHNVYYLTKAARLFFETDKQFGKYTAVWLKYEANKNGGKEDSIVFLLPDDANGMEYIENSISEGRFHNNVTGMLEHMLEEPGRKASVRLPMFRSESSCDFKEILNNLEPKNILENMDFSEFFGRRTEPYTISNVFHRSVINFDEKGVNVNLVESYPSERISTEKTRTEIDFICNKPFIFVVTGSLMQPYALGIVRDVKNTITSEF